MSTKGTAQPVVVNLMKTYGGVITGCYLSQAIWGISTLQVFFYFQNFGRDKAFIKLLVVILWLMDTASQILILKGTYKPLILEYGNFAGLADNQIEIVAHTWLEAVVIFIVQMYFIRRIYMFGKKIQKWMIPFCSLLVALSSWQLIGIIIYWVWAYGKPISEQGKPGLVDVNISIRAAAFVEDVFVALGMIYLLTRQKSQALSKTRKMIFRILIVTINSGTWTALVCFIMLVLIKVYPGQLFFCIFEFSLCSLYFSTLMANLNSRNYVRGDGTVTTILSNDLDEGTNNRMVLGPVGNARANGSTTMTHGGNTAVITKNRVVYIEPEYADSLPVGKSDHGM